MMTLNDETGTTNTNRNITKSFLEESVTIMESYYSVCHKYEILQLMVCHISVSEIYLIIC